MNQKKSAFTLIELLVVIVIIGILATIGVAQFNGYQEKARFAKAQAFASQADTVLMAETALTGNGFPLRLDFEEGSGTTSQDSSGSGNNMADWTGKNVNWVTDTPDNSPSSLSIDSEILQILNIQNMPTDEMTFSSFIRINEWSNGNTYPFFITNNSGFNISPAGRLTFYINQGSQNIISNDGVIQLGRWHHILGSFKDGQLRMFVDGNLIKEGTETLTVPFNVHGSLLTENLIFYLGYGTAGSEYKGDLDRVRIYPVGLDAGNL
jgi:prepilin-type N-terminal cleavage/methylation domain-containing protein